MTLEELYKKLREHTLDYGEQEEAAEAVARVFAIREDTIKAACADCANGVHRDKSNSHILETIQGHVYHERACTSTAIRSIWNANT